MQYAGWFFKCSAPKWLRTESLIEVWILFVFDSSTTVPTDAEIKHDWLTDKGTYWNILASLKNIFSKLNISTGPSCLLVGVWYERASLRGVRGGHPISWLIPWLMFLEPSHRLVQSEEESFFIFSWQCCVVFHLFWAMLCCTEASPGGQTDEYCHGGDSLPHSGSTVTQNYLANTSKIWKT